MSARDVVADTLLNEGCGDSDQCDKTAARVLSALAAAGYEVVPREPTEGMVVAIESEPTGSDAWASLHSPQPPRKGRGSDGAPVDSPRSVGLRAVLG